ncbi:hypothetical protein HK099_005851 [Clydaea vesicula]|uniref:Uncharacterized protein n=1 Tax=Clydaea vesicula TaxID=447962 RepID=A0AAD5XZD9_9FUNG|nr:hypothetical protein HK099_005851 [Clydaea vesicula]
MYRRNSIYGNEDRIILDIGSRFVKAGFSGEPKPRVIKASSPSNITPDLFYLNLQEAEDLEFNLGQLLRTIFHSHLLTDPKQRKVLICESVYLPLELKKLITSVLFWNLQVPSVTFLSSSILALSTLGKTSGVVVDCGNLETSMIPVYDLRPIIPYSKSIPLAGRSVTSRILLLLKNHARAICTERKDDMNPTELSHKMLREITVEKLEDFKIRFCSVSNFSANFKELHKDGYKVYESTKEDIKYPLDINTKLLIPSWIAERAFEVLFEADSEDNSIPSVVLDLLINVINYELFITEKILF